LIHSRSVYPSSRSILPSYRQQEQSNLLHISPFIHSRSVFPSSRSILPFLQTATAM
jgi:hypothetical protein